MRRLVFFREGVQCGPVCPPAIPASLKMQLRRLPLTQQVTDPNATPGFADWFAEQITSR
jgi:hypothetical protein